LNGEIKTFEVRDEGTFIPVMCVMGRAIDQNAADSFLIRRAGWGMDQEFVYLIVLNDGRCQSDPFKWESSNTLQAAHSHIRENWDSLKSGDVVDVEFINGVTQEPKTSERFADGGMF
jgi:hypothetical protein